MGVMELRRLGMVNKPAVIVPNHMQGLPRLLLTRGLRPQ